MRRSALVFMVALAIGFAFAFQGVSSADEVRIVKLITNVGSGGISSQIPHLIEPETLIVNKGAVVVWVNIGAYETGVSFEEGKTCQLGTRDPGGSFKFDEAKHCFETLIVANGGTASLKFLQTGVYEYKVTWGMEPKVSRGKIIVQ